MVANTLLLSDGVLTNFSPQRISKYSADIIAFSLGFRLQSTAIFGVGLFSVDYIVRTELIRGLHQLKRQPRGCVATIGNFDGVHKGHQALLKKLKETADQWQVPAVVITFEPHPLEFLRPEHPVARLTRFREKFFALAEQGVDKILLLRFNQSLAHLPAEDFIRRILSENLNVKHVIVGDDFHFGYERRGDAALLARIGKMLGFTVDSMPTLAIQQHRVSSTRVRQALIAGDHATVLQLLGRPYAMMGRVVHGDKLGQVLGFPTANIDLHRTMTAVQGIYAVRLSFCDDVSPDKKQYLGVASIGTRPTVDGTHELLEVHLFNFNQVLYGRYVAVEFCEKLRAEQRFPNLELMIQQIEKDAVLAKKYFKLERD